MLGPHRVLPDRRRLPGTAVPVAVTMSGWPALTAPLEARPLELVHGRKGSAAAIVLRNERRGHRFHRDLHVYELLDGLQAVDKPFARERHRLPALSRAGGPPDPVHVRLRVLRQIVVDHHVQVIYVESSRGYIGGAEHPEPARLQIVYDLDSLLLREVSHDELTGIAVHLKFLCDDLRHAFGVAEDERVLRVFRFQDAQEETELLILADVVEHLVHLVHGHVLRCNLDLRGAVHELPGDVAHTHAEGSAVQHGHPFLTGPGPPHDLADIRIEPHVKEAVGLVNDQDPQFPEVDLAAIAEIEEPPRGADDEVHTLCDHLLLGDVSNPAVEGTDLVRKVFPERLSVPLDLNGELPGGRNNHRLGAPKPLLSEPEMEDGNEKRGRLAGPGLALDRNITSAQRVGEGFCLDIRAV